MDSIRITNLLSKRCGRTFIGVFPIDRLPEKLSARRPLLLVCNTASSDKPGDHWIVMYIDMKGEFFDSYAELPARTFEQYLKKYCNSVTINTTVIQSTISYSCGHFCVFYCLMKMLNYKMNDIENAFSTDTALNDFIIHRFVCNGL